MRFSESEKKVLIAALTSRGWQLRDDVIWSPSGGLYFNSSHFSDWDPKTMKEVFTQRAARIEKMTYEGAAKSAAENHDVHWAADEVLRGHP